MAPAGALPFGDHAMPLGDHLTTNTRDKILQEEYVDIFSLWFCKLEKKDKEDLDDHEKECLKHRKVDHKWANCPDSAFYERSTHEGGSSGIGPIWLPLAELALREFL